MGVMCVNHSCERVSMGVKCVNHSCERGVDGSEVCES